MYVQSHIKNANHIYFNFYAISLLQAHKKFIDLRFAFCGFGLKLCLLGGAFKTTFVLWQVETFVNLCFPAKAKDKFTLTF